LVFNIEATEIKTSQKQLCESVKSQPDNISALTGKELVSMKVKKLVSMAGRFPGGKEFNVQLDSAASAYVFANWPGSIIFTGWEIGSKIFTGLRLIKSDIANSPVKDVFRISIPKSEEDRNGRMSSFIEDRMMHQPVLKIS
jgi:pyrimidine-specific ribonucleoside hydrolase